MKKLNYFLIFFIPTFVIAFIFISASNFPHPTGAYGVGQIKCHWIDSSRKELTVQDHEHPNRELMAYVYYPANKSDAKINYDTDAAESAIDFLSKTIGWPQFIFNGIKSIQTYNQSGAAVASGATPFPVIIFSPGGSVVVQQYTYMLEELASNGFIVVGVNHPHVAAVVRYPDGHIIKTSYKQKAKDAQGKAQLIELNAQDISFVLNKINELVITKDNFWNHADLNNIGIMGHSFGGRTATKVIRRDPRIKCGINMDGGAQSEDLAEQFTKPFMFMIAEKSFLYNENFPAYATETKPFLDRINELANAENSITKVQTIKDIGHSGFIDTPLQLNATMLMRLVAWFKPSLLDGSAHMVSDIHVNVVLPTIVKFFDENLKNKNDVDKKHPINVFK